MSKQEPPDDARHSGYRSLPQPMSQAVPSYPLVNTPQSLADRQSNASFPGGTYNPPRPDTRPASTLQQASSITGQTIPGKVAIPTLRQSKAESAKLSKKGRTSHACDACRKAKAGCSGGNPCSRCRTTRSACVYGDGKRDRERKELTKLSRETQYLMNQNSEFKDAILRIRQKPDLDLDGMKSAIDELLAKKFDSLSPSLRQGSPASLHRMQNSELEEIEDGIEDERGAEVGSIGSLDETGLDTDRPENKGIGHLGKSASSDWQHRTVEIATREVRESGDIRVAPITAVSSYHTEDADLEYLDTSIINIYALPDSRLAGDLVQAYFDNVGDIFPVLDKAAFLSKYTSFINSGIISEPGKLSYDDNLWLATLNCIFALSAYHGRLSKNPQMGEARDHLVYCTRATSLLSQQNILLQDASIESTRLVGLLSLYFLSTNRVNKAWTLCGLAFKNALALGLHVKSVSKEISDAEREHRVRLFWSLYTLECTLDVLTGRPACIADRDIGAPLPMNIEDVDLRTGANFFDSMEGVKSQETSNSSGSRRESRASDPAGTFEMPTSADRKRAIFSSSPLPLTSSTFFVYRIQLTILSHQTISQLYCAATAKEKWIDIEMVMRRIDESLLTWANNLPADFSVKFDPHQPPNLKDPNILSRTSLALFYNTSRMSLFRPCLCPTKDHTKSQSPRSQEISRISVENCLGAARNTIAILSWFATSSQQLYSLPPFWNTLHYLCEALSVLLLELALKCEHVPNNHGAILADAKKGIRWLVDLSAESISARKAWEIFDKLLHLVAKINGFSISDMPTQAPVPRGYNFFRHATMHPQQPEIPPYASLPNAMGDISYGDLNAGQTFAQQQPFGQSDYQFHVNPLDDAAALERFMGLGQLNSQFEDPWGQHFMVDMVQPPLPPSQHDAGPHLMGGLDLSMSGMALPVNSHSVAGPMSMQQHLHHPTYTTQQQQRRQQQQGDISPRAGFVAPLSYNNTFYPPGSQGRY